jgi:hypothetical protein
MRDPRDLSYDKTPLSPSFSHCDAEVQPVDPCETRDALEQFVAINPPIDKPGTTNSTSDWFWARVDQLKDIVKSFLVTRRF